MNSSPNEAPREQAPEPIGDTVESIEALRKDVVTVAERLRGKGGDFAPIVEEAVNDFVKYVNDMAAKGPFVAGPSARDAADRYSFAQLVRESAKGARFAIMQKAGIKAYGPGNYEKIEKTDRRHGAFIAGLKILNGTTCVLDGMTLDEIPG